MLKKIGKTIAGLGLFWGSVSMAIKMINGEGVDKMGVDTFIAYFVCIITLGVIASLLIPDETASVFLVLLSGAIVASMTYKGSVSWPLTWAVYVGAIATLRSIIMNIVWGKIRKAISGPKRFES